MYSRLLVLAVMWINLFVGQKLAHPAVCRGYNPTTEHVMRKLDLTNLSADITRLRNLGITDFMLSEACNYIGAGDKPGVALDKVLNGSAITDDERGFVLDQLSDYAEFFS
jgi:hypothetical protein